jgi:uncharacterized membrane protein
MNRFVTVVVPDEKKAYECVRALEDLHREGAVTVYATAVVQREANGTLSVVKRCSDEGPLGIGVGVLLGALMGAFTAGPAGAVAGAASGGLIAGLGGLHAEVSEEFVEELARELRPGNFAVLAEVAEQWMAPIDARIGQLGGTVVRESRDHLVDELIQRRVDVDRAKLERFKADRALARAQKMESDLERQIESVAGKLRKRAEKAQKHLDATKEEMDAKLNALQDQAAKAKPDTKALIDKRIAELRKDSGERVEKLRRAYETMQAVVRA